LKSRLVAHGAQLIEAQRETPLRSAGSSSAILTATSSRLSRPSAHPRADLDGGVFTSRRQMSRFQQWPRPSSAARSALNSFAA
jgi:hypothetical protein